MFGILLHIIKKNCPKKTIAQKGENSPNPVTLVGSDRFLNNQLSNH
jgi:hypothetical protein